MKIPFSKKPSVIINIEEFLKQESSPVDIENDLKRVKKIIKELEITAEANKGKCIGLAANQIGYLDRICVMLHDGKWRHIINPVIIARSKERKQMMERCLSRPLPSKVKRHAWVLIDYFTIEGKLQREKFKGLPARIIQHEIDHFNGVLI
jgi:peptide deformylase